MLVYLRSDYHLHNYMYCRYLTSEWKSKKKDDEPKLFDQMTITCPSVSRHDDDDDVCTVLVQYKTDSACFKGMC